jgi:hypothetical protein
MGPWLRDQAQDAGGSGSSTNTQVIAGQFGGSLAGIGGGTGGVRRHSVQCPIGNPKPMNRMYASIAFICRLSGQ